MAVQTLIVEDDTASLKVVQRLVEQNSELKLVGSAQNADDAVAIAKETEIELVLLDIGIPEITGLELIKQFPGEPFIILTTGYKEYALEAFEYGVIDYLVKPINPERFNQAIAKALEQINLYRANEFADQQGPILRMLRFLYSRNITTLKPTLDRDSQIGFSYPFLSLQYQYSETYRILDDLEETEQEEVLLGGFHEIIHLCSNCNEGFLQYREVCPKCESSNLISEDLIHHFPCAYIGPMSDYTTDTNTNMLVCPKCDQYLRHIGVDYDKPSLIYTCQNCYNRFQDVFAYAKCLNCSADTAVEYLRRRIVRQFEVTAKGLEATLNPQILNSKDSRHKEGLQVVDQETFDLMLQFEIKRRNSSPFEANIGAVQILDDSNQDKALRNDVLKEFQNRVLLEFKEVSNQEDIIMYKDSQTLLFSMLGPELYKAKMTSEQMARNLRNHIESHFPGEPVSIKVSVESIQRGQDPDYIKEKVGKQLDAR